MSREKLLDLDLPWRDGPLVGTVSRGTLCKRVQEQWTEIRKLAEGEELLEFKKFVGNLKDSDHFGGVLHRNTFKVSHRIGLMALGFFGPHEENSAFYDVFITVEDQKRRKTLHVAEWYNVKGKKGQTFHVHFDNMIVLEANTFYSIGFQLDGPKMGILDPDKVISEWIGFVGELGMRLEFNFLRGSMQMPEIKYVLL